MRCTACGYKEAVGAVSVDVVVRDGDMIPDGKAKFNRITARDVHGSPIHFHTDLYACPNCGTVRMEV